jgi:hypothetical protein
LGTATPVGSSMRMGNSVQVKSSMPRSSRERDLDVGIINILESSPTSDGVWIRFCTLFRHFVDVLPTKRDVLPAKFDKTYSL